MEKIGGLIRKISENQIRKNLKEADSVFVVGFAGLSSSRMNVLRQSLRKSKSNLFVIKNSITKRVFNDCGLKELSEMLQGPCGLVFIKNDLITTSRILYNFAKENQSLKIEGGILKNRILYTSDIAILANLLSKEMLYTKIVMSIKSPISNFVSVLSNTLKRLVMVLDQIKEKNANTETRKGN